MTQRHTAGPWMMGADPGHVTDRRGNIIAELWPVHAKRKANGKLIVAAPDMFSALQDIANHDANGKPLSADTLARIARAALAKATQP